MNDKAESQPGRHGHLRQLVSALDYLEDHLQDDSFLNLASHSTCTQLNRLYIHHGPRRNPDRRSDRAAPRTETPCRLAARSHRHSGQEPPLPTAHIQRVLRVLLCECPVLGPTADIQHFEVTPSIGREFGADLQLLDILNAPNSEELLRELAILVSRRGVCFFRGQELSGEDMTRFAAKLSEMSGQPQDSGHCTHPIGAGMAEMSADSKPKTMEISASKQRKGGGINRR